MKTLYLDLISGISGDMFLGALIDLGVDMRRLEKELTKLKLNGFHLHAARRKNHGIAGVKFDVHLEEEHHHGPGHHAHHDDAHLHHHHDDDHGGPAGSNRDFSDIKRLLAKSALSPWVKQKAAAIFGRIAVAEGKVHGQKPETVHFHEVGAVDSIVDIVGACLALEMLGKPQVLASPVVDGTGWVDCAHGRYPVPTAATLEILGARGIPISQCEEPHELVTPTGAALLAELVDHFGPMAGLIPSKIGYGLGTRQLTTRPNCLRVILGELAAQPPDSITGIKTDAAANDWEVDTVAVLETNLDDSHAEILGQFLEFALAAGALDVFHTPIQMKKNRPGVLLTVLCAAADAERFAELILRETSAFGVRGYLAERRKLQREFRQVKTPDGEVTVKLGKLNGKVLQAAPEFESCKQLARQTGVPLKQIYAAALKAASGKPRL